MSFIVVERDPADGAIRVLLPHEFDERGAALEALSVAVSTGDASVGGEVLIADLSAAVPVLIMPTAAAPEPAAGAWEAPVEPPEAEGGTDAHSDGAAADAIFGDIASALRRAATSLESEGVVAPDSISSEEPSAPDEDAPEAVAALDEGVPEAAGAPDDGVSDAVAALDETVPNADDMVTEPVGEEWPWANVESYATATDDSPVAGESPDDDQSDESTSVSALEYVEDTATDLDEAAAGAFGEQVDTAAPAVPDDEASPFLQVAEPASVGFESLTVDEPLLTSDPLEEPAVEESSLIIPNAVDGDDAFLPKPVILGDYEDEAPDLDAQIASLGAVEPAVEATPDLDAQIADLGAGEADGDDESTETVETEGVLSDTDITEIAEPEAEVIVTDSAPEAAEPEDAASESAITEIAEPEAEVIEYVVGTELDLGEYACDDCIYVNTCPKVGQSTPAECGSFQWKSD